MIILALIIFLGWGTGEEFKKATLSSVMNASVMALMTSGAAFLVLLAFRFAPNANTVP